MAADTAATYLDITVEALRKRSRRGEIPFIRLGRLTRWDRFDLDLMMRRQRVDATEAS
jgi:excisionase family DNA binding protein